MDQKTWVLGISLLPHKGLVVADDTRTDCNSRQLIAMKSNDLNSNLPLRISAFLGASAVNVW